jgi:hypothetical protein
LDADGEIWRHALAGSQMVPQDSFRVGLLATQATSVLLRRFNRAHLCRMFAARREKTSAKRNRISIRALNEARYKRTLTFVLSLTGRGNRNGDSAIRQHLQNEIANILGEMIIPSFSQAEISARKRSFRLFCLVRGALRNPVRLSSLSLLGRGSR